LVAYGGVDEALRLRVIHALRREAEDLEALAPTAPSQLDLDALVTKEQAACEHQGMHVCFDCGKIL
jgi:hypothetical protein